MFLKEQGIQPDPGRKIYAEQREVESQKRRERIEEIKKIEREQRQAQTEKEQAVRSFLSVIKATAKEKAKQEKHQKMFAPKKAICKHCGKEWMFYPSEERYGKKQPYRYCSRKCRITHNKSKDSDNIGHRLRKYGTAGAQRDVIHLDDLIKRDNGVCYLCGCETSKEDSWKDAKGYHVCGGRYPTIDHVIPLSKGGTHTWTNVKLACRNCNSIKEARILGAANTA